MTLLAVRSLFVGVGKLIVAAAVALGALVSGASVAGAHTSLVRSEPADRSIGDVAPDQLSLVFVNTLDPRSVSVEVKALDGTTVGSGERVTPDQPASSTITFDLPTLEAGTYGLAWQAVGDDGHRVTGETVVGVGDPTDPALARQVDDAGFSPSDPIGRLLELGTGLGRSVWYVGLSLLVGSCYVLWWRLRVPAARASSSATARQLHRSASWWVRTGWLVALIAALAEWLIVIVSRLRYLDLEGSVVARGIDAVASLPAIGWAVAALATMCVLPALRRLRRADRYESGTRTDVQLLVIGLVLAAGWSVAAGHAAGTDGQLVDVLSVTAHLAAATIWVGPIAVISLTAVTERWRNAEVADRRVLLAAFFRGYANVALIAFVVIAVSGIYTAWVTLEGRWFESTYTWILLGKLALVVLVVVPLALHHDHVVRRSRSDSPTGVSPPEQIVGEPSTASASGSRRFLGTVRVETLALVLVLGLAALLGGLDPGFEVPTTLATDDEAELFADSAVIDVDECARREIGQPSCYRDYFRSVMETEGADVAVAEIESLAATDDFVAIDCHQITHDLGQDAIEHYGDLGRVLSFEASACWSGYYHGAVETELSKLDDQELLDVVPDVCADASEDLYSFSHYNCVHGVGHGLMLRFDADLWKAIPYCETYDGLDEWERRSCLGGAFMQNIVSAQEGEPASLRDDDLLYPCTALEGSYRAECLGMQTSWVLYQLDYDYGAGFGVCDTLDAVSARTCYQSMGRDISGGSHNDVGTVIANCDLGGEAHRESCIVGASLDAVYDDHDTVRATKLCDAVDDRWRAACVAARDSAASTF